MTIDDAKTRLADLIQSKSENDKMIEDLESEARILKKRLHLES